MSQQLGAQNGASVLTDNQVVAMRQLYLSSEWSMKELAEKFNVNKGTVVAVVACLNWRWLLDPGEEQALADMRTQRDTKQNNRKVRRSWSR